MVNNFIDRKNMISNKINDSEHLFVINLGSKNLWNRSNQMCKKLTVIKTRGDFIYI